MASSTGEEPPSSPVEQLAPSMDAKLMEATEKPHPGVINPLLLAVVCTGSWRDLESLLGWEDYRAIINCTESLLEGVTVGGDTALHAVATNGDDGNFLSTANIIYLRAGHLLFVQNKKGDTPLHCAARAGRLQMVSSLIRLVKDEDNGVKLKKLLETENDLKETALHDAVRIGNNDMVKLLMEEDPELACFPNDGTSPLYLAILLENEIIAKTLYNESGGILSYSGPDGQNALHAAVLRGTGMTEMLLAWKKDLAEQADQNGSMPLHFAASLLGLGGRSYWIFRRRFPWILYRWHSGIPMQPLLHANSQQLYQSDHEGLFPIHVAASVGADRTVAMFVSMRPSTASLRDAKGRTFLHIAVEKKNFKIVGYACRNRSLSWILNMRDNDGNTALHLAVQDGSLRLFCSLFGNRNVQLNLTNDKGQSPIDISRYKIPQGLHYRQNSEQRIYHALVAAGARNGCCRKDHFEENYTRHVLHGEAEETEKIKDSTQALCIGSVLIASVTFGATFALPGGYIADDHTNGGTPTLAGRYAFDAFVIANTIAFICSSIATFGLMFSGISMLNVRSRRMYLSISAYFMGTSIISLVGAFALGAYMVLAPVAPKTAIAVCVMSPLVVLSRKMEFCIKLAQLARPFCARKGLIWTLNHYTITIGINMLIEFWPIIVTFGWAAYATN